MRISVFNKEEKLLHFVLSLTTQKFLDRRHQTIVLSNQYAKSICIFCIRFLSDLKGLLYLEFTNIVFLRL